MKWLLCFLLSVSLSWAQVHESLAVTVREIRVHVLDKNGLPVKGLSADDFKLYSGGKAQSLNYFGEVNLFERRIENVIGQSPAESEAKKENGGEAFGRTTVVFVDSSLQTKKDFENVKKTLLNFIRINLNPPDRLKIIHWDKKSLEITGFTQEYDEAAEAIEAMVFSGSMRRKLVTIQRSINYKIKEWELADDERVALETTINNLIEEKRVLKSSHYNNFYRSMITVGSVLEKMSGPKSIFLFTGGGYLEESDATGETVELNKHLSMVLNRANTTIYAIMTKSQLPLGGNGPNLKTLGRGFSNELKISSVFPPENSVAIKRESKNTVSEDLKAIESGPEAAAKSTGGLFVTSKSGSNLEKQFNRVKNVSGHFYRLAYSPDTPHNHTKISIKLKEKKPGWIVLYGQDFEGDLPYHEMNAEERASAMTRMLLYSSSYRDDFETNWDAKTYKQGSTNHRIAVLGEISTHESFEKGLEIGFVALDEDRKLLDLVTSNIFQGIPEKRVSFYNVLFSKQSPMYVRFYARNPETGSYSFGEMEVEPNQREDKTRLSDLVMGQVKASKIIPLNQTNLAVMKTGEAHRNAVLRCDLDPFRIKKHLFAPNVEPYVFDHGTLGFLFHLENSKNEDYEVQYLVKSPHGYHHVPGKILDLWKDQLGSVHYRGEIETDILEKGKYLLYVRVRNTKSNEKYTSGAAFELN